MHFIRRAALRAASSSTSFVSKPRTINTQSPFALRSSNQKAVSPAVFRRFSSDDVNSKEENSEEQSTVGSAIDSATSWAQDTAASATEAVSSTFGGVDRARYQDRTIQPAIEPTNGCYIGNLLFDVTEEDLKREFSPFGNIVEVRLTRDARGLSKGFAYITFDTVAEATAAIEARHQTVFEGRRLVVNYINKAPKQREMNPPSKCLFIGNLAFEMTDADLNSLFREVRNVVDVRVAIDRRTGQPRGFAHADFVDVESAQKAMEQLQGKKVFERALRVDFSLGERTPGGRSNDDYGRGRGGRENRGSGGDRGFGGGRY